MSRYSIQSEKYFVAYGYDPIPNGGYFFQVYDRERINDDDEGLIINEGYEVGLAWIDMLALMTNVHLYLIKITPQFTEHLILVSANKPF